MLRHSSQFLLIFNILCAQQKKATQKKNCWNALSGQNDNNFTRGNVGQCTLFCLYTHTRDFNFKFHFVESIFIQFCQKVFQVFVHSSNDTSTRIHRSTRQPLTLSQLSRSTACNYRLEPQKLAHNSPHPLARCRTREWYKSKTFWWADNGNTVHTKT